MIQRAVILFLIWAFPAVAAPVEVTTGEHEGFTRVVLNFGAQTDWEFGRTVDGYRFRPLGKSAEFDLAPVFDRIGKTRLASISANKVTSELDIGFACACHAIPFEFRPGIVVIDLRDGPPPKGSSFENDLPPKQMEEPPQPAAEPTPDMPAASAYNWLDRFAGPEGAAQKIATLSLAPLPSSRPDLQPLRDQLLRQLSRGASQGVIDLSIPKPTGPIPPKADLDAVRVGLGEMRGVTTKTARAADAPLGASGAQCVETAALTILDWATPETDTATLLAQDMLALVGEFDQPVAEAVTRAARVRIFLGFGTEARLILSAFPNVAEAAPVLTSLSYIVDGEADPSQSFAGQGRCSTAAALWAALSDEGISQIGDLDTKAVILAFSALPDHLRRTIGPRLIDRFLDLKDEDSATTLRNIIFRASDVTSSEVALAEAKIDLAKGDAAAAEAHLDQTTSGATQTGAEALITRVKARVAQGLPVDDETVTALDALQSEMKDTELADDIAIAMIHAQAASGNFDTAFAALADQPKQAAVVWRALGSLGDDSTLLTFAVPAPSAPIAGLGVGDVDAIAARLFGLGLPALAADWIAQGGSEIGVLRAQIALALQDGQGALRALESVDEAEAAPLRAAALAVLGQHRLAAIELEPISDAAQIKELARAKDWDKLAQVPTSPWAPLARDVTQTPPVPDGDIDTFGPMARGLALADQSAQTRAKIDQLLATVPAP